MADVELGIKYLGFILKHNDYHKKDLDWMIQKVEKRLHLWCNKWLSKGGRMILVKSVLEVAPSSGSLWLLFLQAPWTI